MSPGRFAGILMLLAALCACSKDISFDEHMANARLFIETSEYDEAVSELKSALLQDRRSGEARWLLGRIYFDTGDIPSAEKELKRALELGWPASEVVPLYAESLLLLGKYDVLEGLDESGLEPGVKASLLASRALAASQSGQRHSAITLVDKALEESPDSPTALLAKARILVSEADFSAAELVMENVMPRAMNNGAAWSLMGDIHVGLRNPEKAVTDYDTALELKKSDHATLFKRALLHLRLENYTAAQADTSRLMRLYPQESGVNYLQGLIHYQAGRYEDALTPLGIGAADARQYPLALFFLSSTHLRFANVDQAAALALKYHERVPDSIRGRKLLSYMYLLQGRYEEVWQLLGPVLQAYPEDPGALQLMASAMLRGNRVNEAFTQLSQLADLRDAPMDTIPLGPGRLLAGDSDDSAQYLETSLEVDKELQPVPIFAVMRLLKDEDYQAALAAAESYARRVPQSTVPLNLVGRVHLAGGRQEQARQSFEQALELEPADPAANLSLARMAMLEDDVTAARDYYTRILERHQENLTALVQLAQLEQREGNGDAFVWNLERAIWAHGGSLEPRLLLGRYHLAEGQPEKVALQFKNLEEVQQQSTQVVQLNALAKLAREEQAKQREQARALAESQVKPPVRDREGFDLEDWGRRLIVRQVYKMAPRYGLDPRMVLAVIKAESNFNPGARSHANAVGLMQLIPATAARFGVRDRTNPIQNMVGGMSYLRWLLSFFDGDIKLALAGYNAGEGAVVKYLGIPPYPETQDYVQKVMKTYGRRSHPSIDPVVKPTRFMAAIREKQAGRS
jgi:putative PEP-CTERM system TPR-repeat lipoprotein